jgi:uncharacterized protein (DUF2147 family)
VDWIAHYAAPRLALPAAGIGAMQLDAPAGPRHAAAIRFRMGARAMSPFRIVLTAAVMLASAAAFAANDTPVGTWKTIDDATGQAKAIVQITQSNGELQGKVIEVLKSDDGPHPVCSKCEGERKDQPIEGMTILWGLTRDGDSWSGGKILDPHSGKVYKAKMTLTDNGMKLQVRGYIGFSLLGRTQVWQRQ